MNDSTRLGTVLGLIAIAFWSTAVAFARSVQESLGMFTAMAALYLLSGSAGCLSYLLHRDNWRGLKDYSIAFYLVCGGLFVAYMASLYMGLGLSASRAQVLEVGVINGMWPCLTLVLSVFILQKRPRWWIVPGTMLALGGLFFVLMSQRRAEMIGAPRRWWVYLFGVSAAITWALYSNFSARLGGRCKGNAVPIFLLATGIVFLIIRCFFDETSHWTARSITELFYQALLPGAMSYMFWDIAMRKGNMPLVVSVSYLSPLLSLMVSSVYLRERPNWMVWTACGLVIAGAVVCRMSFLWPPVRPRK